MLDIFHPSIATWFKRRVGEPTDVQNQAWPRIADGENVLITAPTGSGKTLASFLWAIHQLATETYEGGVTRVLYVSPLKALNNDIQRNLLTPIAELEDQFTRDGLMMPEIRVMTRSGDTPQSDRRRMVSHPPEILITTPESLNLLLSSKSGRSILTELRTVILDEVHGVYGSKRGVHLMSAVERLTRLSGEFQRVSLSATIRPLSAVAEFVGGSVLEGDVLAPTYRRRDVAIVESRVDKRYEIGIQASDQPIDPTDPEAVWAPMVEAFKETIQKNRSTLLFANSRRLTESLTAKINEDELEPLAYSHHGSLSREIRAEVEAKLKAGALKAIIATNSLEMGIDIGALDEVVLIQAPPSVSSAIQRVGRAGHSVGAVTRGSFYPTHQQDFLESAVLARDILDGDIEAIRPVQSPLDVLSQVIVSMVAMETWDMDALYAFIRTCSSFRDLQREPFDLVLNMLAGRYADSRIQELQPRISIDRIDNSIQARKGAIQVLYMAGGTIPDRGYFNMRHHESNARIGDLDEEFVWESDVGKTFTLGTQNWRVERITHNDVFVSPIRNDTKSMPFWKGESYSRDFHFSESIGRFLEDANDRVARPDFVEELQDRYCMTQEASQRLVTFLKEQKSRTRHDLPHRHHLLVEAVDSGPEGVPGNQVVLHTLWGGRVNVPLALALDAAWEAKFDQRIEVFPNNDGISVMVPHEVDPEEILSLVSASQVETLLRERLESSGFFGARFRECAGRALVMTKNRMNERMPLWLSRMKSKKLLAAVSKYDDFPILLETWRTCLQDEFDLENLTQVLSELEGNTIRWSFCKTNYPSPMAQSGAWRQVNEYMYMSDEPPGDLSSNLRQDLLRDAVFVEGLRPAVSGQICDRFEEKRQRLWPGYSPGSARDLLDWLIERVAIPADEWDLLLGKMAIDHEVDADAVVEEIADRVVRVDSGTATFVCALERLDRVVSAFGLEEATATRPSGEGVAIAPVTYGEDENPATTYLGDWFAYYGPIDPVTIPSLLGLSEETVRLAIEDLVATERVIVGELVAGDSRTLACDASNFESLLRIARADAVPEFEAQPIESLQLFLARYQGVTRPVAGEDGLVRAVEQLSCYQAPAAAWETEFLPARVRDYASAQLDALVQEGGVGWLGGENRRVSFFIEPDFDLLYQDDSADTAQDLDVTELFPDQQGRYDFMTLTKQTGLTAKALSDRLWEGVWASSVVNDSFGSVRKGLETQFEIPTVASASASPRRSRRSGYGAWRGSLPLPGNWFPVTPPEPPEDYVEREEKNKDRVRVLLDRYGVLFRELLARESPAFRWSQVFRTLRLMELSGEVVAGYFFEGIPGPQFASPKAFRMLRQEDDAEAVFWMNATDPASLAGLQVDVARGRYPRRLMSNHLVFRGTEVIAQFSRSGKEIQIELPPDDDLITSCFGPLKHLLYRDVQAVRTVTVETINGKDAEGSDYVDVLRTMFDVRTDYKTVMLYRNL